MKIIKIANPKIEQERKHLVARLATLLLELLDAMQEIEQLRQNGSVGDHSDNEHPPASRLSR